MSERQKSFSILMSFYEAIADKWQWHQLDHDICISCASHFRQTILLWHPTNSVKALKTTLVLY